MIGGFGQGRINCHRLAPGIHGYCSPGVDGARREPGHKLLLNGRAPHRDAGLPWLVAPPVMYATLWLTASPVCLLARRRGLCRIINRLIGCLCGLTAA